MFGYVGNTIKTSISTSSPNGKLAWYSYTKQNKKYTPCIRNTPRGITCCSHVYDLWDASSQASCTGPTPAPTPYTGGLPYVACTGKSKDLILAQCKAYQDLYHSTNGETWNFCSRDATDPCGCDFSSSTSSIICTRSKGILSITGLNLIGLGMRGTLPASLATMTDLTNFRIGCNNLHGQLPNLNFSKAEGRGCIVGGPQLDPSLVAWASPFNPWIHSCANATKIQDPSLYNTAGNNWTCDEFDKGNSYGFEFNNSENGCSASCS